jgi:hypothetical protein
MAVPELPDYHPQMIEDLKAVIATIVGILISLVGVIYLQLRSTDTHLQGQAEEDREKITNNAIAIEKLTKDVESIRNWVKSLEKDIDTGQIKQLQDHESIRAIEQVVNVIKVLHKHQHNEDV